MARPPDSPLDRLRRQVWVRALRNDYKKSILGRESSNDPAKAFVSWSELGRLLVQQDAVAGSLSQIRLQGLLGIVNKGSDPRRTILRIPVKEMARDAPQSVRIVKRRPSGRLEFGNDQNDGISYAEIPINLVDCGEALCPGSSQWMHAYLWELTKSALPKLEVLRGAISQLKQKLGVCTLPQGLYRQFLNKSEIDHEDPTNEIVIQRYRNSLQRFAELPTANSLSLLAALTTESYITGHEILLELHQECFHQASNLYFDDPEYSDIKDVIDMVVIRKIALQEWAEPFTYHISSLNSPFITVNTAE